MLLLALALATFPVRPELVEGRPALLNGGRPSTSSGRTEGGSAIEAERAFAADAQAIGQWAAFRKWAAPDATMFVPQPIKAKEWLKDREEPAKAVEWWPTASWVSCDGTLAVNTGGTRWPDGRIGSFTTVWARRPEGWRWLMDKGNDISTAIARVKKPREVRASCGGRAWIDMGGFVDVQLYFSHDRSLVAGWDNKGASSFFMNRWSGHRYRYLDDRAIAGRR